MLNNCRNLLKTNPIFRCSISSYSKKNKDFTDNCFKPISSRKPKNGKSVLKYPKYSLCDLFIKSKDFPFVLPGNVGLGWSNYESTLEPLTKDESISANEIKNSKLMLIVDWCPIVLRLHLNKVFPVYHLNNADLSVITFSMKYNQERCRQNLESELEKTAQVFVVNAKSICDKLRKAGFWADFINPFSGKPYTSIQMSLSEKESDKIDEYSNFETIVFNECKVVSKNLIHQKFIGNIFTNAPAKKSVLNPILWDEVVQMDLSKI